MADRKYIVEITPHKVRTGETLDGLAKANKLSWQMLAKFNWGTAEPDKINKHLRMDVGCTKKTKDRKNYQFDDSDDPGIVYIPKPFRSRNLSTKKIHTIRVQILPAGKPKDFIFSF
jgi:hypothetical protein